MRPILIALLGIACIAGATVGPRPAQTPTRAGPCALGPSNPTFQPAERLSSSRGTENGVTSKGSSCAPYAVIPVRILGAVSSLSFENPGPVAIAALEDGSVMVEAGGFSLYRIARGRVAALWGPDSCSQGVPFNFFIGSFDDQAVINHWKHQIEGVRTDGSLSFSWRSRVFGANEYSGSGQSSVGAADGTVWFAEQNGPNDAAYAYSPPTRTTLALDKPEFIWKLMRSPNGRVYATSGAGLFELLARPKVHARLIRGPLSIPKDIDESLSAVQAVGSDGSLWASTPSEVVHIHRNGKVRVLRLDPRSVPELPDASALQLTMAPDGSVWVLDSKMIRITDDDRVEVIDTRFTSWGYPISFAPDSSVWAIARDSAASAMWGVVHFAPARFGEHGMATLAFPKANPTATPFVPCGPPTPPPTPIPALPPSSGAVQFIYVANLGSNTISGYWIGRNGALTAVRGSPFATEQGPQSVTIDPLGRFVYAGGYPGISAYAVDAQTGSLRQVPGSPFVANPNPTDLAIDKSGKYVYANNLGSRKVSVYSIAADGAVRPVRGSTFSVDDWGFRLFLNPTRDVAYGVTDSSVEAFDTAGGRFLRIGQTLELTRFRGHFRSYSEGVHYGKTPHVPAGVPA